MMPRMAPNPQYPTLGQGPQSPATLNPQSISAAFGGAGNPTPASDPSRPYQSTPAQQDNNDPGVRGLPIAQIPPSDEVSQMSKAQTVRALFQKARDARRPLVTRWKKNYRVLNNQMWTARAEPWMPNPEVADIWPLVASMVSWMTDQRPGFNVTAACPPFSSFVDYYDRIADDANAILDASFSTNQEDAEIERVLWDVATYSVGYLKTKWEPWLANGLGDAVMRRVDPFTLYPDPHARNMADANFIIEAKIMSMDDLDRAFPGAAGKIYPGINDQIDTAPHQTDQTVQPNQPRVNIGPLAPNTGFSVYQPSGRPTTMISEDPVVVVLECWVRTHAIITPQQDKTLQDGTARVQDRWKCIVVCNNTVLMDKYADEIYGFTTHPYSKMTLFDTGDWYGPCLVEFLTSPQESINRMLATIEHNLLLLGNPILLEGRRTNIGGRATLSNRPGQRIAGSKADTGFMDPPVIHPDFMKMIEYYESKLETISGLTAIMKGYTTTGRNSADVVSSLQDSAFVRVRATLRNLERMLRDAGGKKLATIAEFYTEPRVVNILGPSEQPSTVLLKARHFYNLRHPDDSPDELPTPLQFGLLCDAGSDHPTSRQARQQQAERFYALGAIDDLELLRTSRWPDAAGVAQRVTTAKAQGLMQAPGKRGAARAG